MCVRNLSRMLIFTLQIEVLEAVGPGTKGFMRSWGEFLLPFSLYPYNVK